MPKKIALNYSGVDLLKLHSSYFRLNSLLYLASNLNFNKAFFFSLTFPFPNNIHLTGFLIISESNEQRKLFVTRQRKK